MQAPQAKAIAEVMTTAAPPMPHDTASRLALEHFGVSVAAIKPLDSERDQNFYLKGADGAEYVLKIANPAEDPAVTNLQTSALLHIAAADPACPVPRVFTSRGGAPEVKIIRDGCAQVMRLLSFMPGKPMGDTGRTSLQRKNLGAALARLTRALRGFSHPAARHDLMWDLKHAARTRDLIPAIKDAARRKMVTDALEGFEQYALPQMNILRAQVVHNDFHPDNVLVRTDDTNAVAGVIDFGDCVHTALVNDLAIAAAYHLGDDIESLLAPAAEVVGSYHAVLPLTEAEIGLLFDLIVTRVAMARAINGWRAALYPDNQEYLLGSDAVKWRNLELLAAMPRTKAQDIFHQACKGS